jgi:hypothetical protein
MGQHINGKYVVAKVEDIANLDEGWDGDGVSIEGHAIMLPFDKLIIDGEEGVFIRFQDVFAPTVLWSYVNAIRAAVEIIELEAKATRGVNDAYLRKLNEYADHFAEMAQMANEFVGKKFPD